jgi:hypothetical protein
MFLVVSEDFQDYPRTVLQSQERQKEAPRCVAHSKWLRNSTYIDYKQCVMDDLGRFREKWVDESNRWGAGLQRGWGEGLLFSDAGTVPNAPSKDLVFQSEQFKTSRQVLFQFESVMNKRN